MMEFILAAVITMLFVIALEPAHRRILRRGPHAYGTDRTRVLAEWWAAARHADARHPDEAAADQPEDKVAAKASSSS